MGFGQISSKVLPYRTRSSIYKHIRRKYHIFEQRGKWTPEEDQELARLCLEKEGHWTEVGKLLGRMPEDCRDRWRNYMKCGSKRGSKRWSKEEEELLTTVVNEMIEEAYQYKGRRHWRLPTKMIDTIKCILGVQRERELAIILPSKI